MLLNLSQNMLVRGKSSRIVDKDFCFSVCTYVVYVHTQLCGYSMEKDGKQQSERGERNRRVREIYLEGGLDKERENDRDSCKEGRKKAQERFRMKGCSKVQQIKSNSGKTDSKRHTEKERKKQEVRKKEQAIEFIEPGFLGFYDLQ